MDLKLDPASFRIVLAGGGSLHTGLVPFLNRLGIHRFEHWPTPEVPGWPGPRFTAAYGAALQHLGKSHQPVSLLPAATRQFWRGHHSLNLVHSLIFFLLSMLAVFLALGTWQKYELLTSKKNLLAQSQAALNKAQQADTFGRQLRHDYEQLLPLLRHQRQTLDTLQALALLKNSRSNLTFWYVLFADPKSYFTARPWGETNPPPPSATPIVAPPFHKGFITELCLPEQGDAMRQSLSQLVDNLKQSPLFQNVDSLRADLRRSLVDPAVLLPEHFTLVLELPDDPFPAQDSAAAAQPSSNNGPSLRGLKPDGGSTPLNSPSVLPQP